MTIVACPRCHDDVTAPDHASPEAVVRCPFCGEQYPLAEALAGIPPMLTVVAPGPLSPTSGADLQLAGPVETARPFVFEERPAPVRRPTAAAAARRPRPRRPEKNLLVEAVKVVAGGVVGLTIGQLILWWMPGKWGLSQRDPLGLGQRIGMHVPFLVPAEVRGDFSGLAGDAGAGPAGNRPTQSANSDRDSMSGGRRPGTNRPSTNRPPDSGRPLLKTPGGTTDPSPPPGTPPSDPGSSSSPSSSTDLAPPLPDPGGAPGVRSAPVVAADELSAMLAAAQLQWEQTMEEERPAAVAATLAEIAHDVTFIDVMDPDGVGVGEAVRSWLTEVAATPETRAALMAAVENTDLVPERPLAGRLLCGTVTSIEPAGQLFETRLTLADEQPAVVLSRRDPSSTYAPGEQVLILGALVTNPQQQLVGYEGTARRATYGGLVIKPAAE